MPLIKSIIVRYNIEYLLYKALNSLSQLDVMVEVTKKLRAELA